MRSKNVIWWGFLVQWLSTALSLKKAEDIPGILKKAFYIASTGRPGPVVVDIPKDTVNPTLKYPYEYPKSVELRSYNPTVNGHKGQIKKALKALLVAKKPVLFVGGGAMRQAVMKN